MSDERCEHMDGIEDIKHGDGAACVDCVVEGSTWVHLRTCQQCGLTRCCDSSPKKHATGHFKAAAHPVMASAEPGERWLWCYVDEQMINY